MIVQLWQHKETGEYGGVQVEHGMFVAVTGRLTERPTLPALLEMPFIPCPPMAARLTHERWWLIVPFCNFDSEE